MSLRMSRLALRLALLHSAVSMRCPGSAAWVHASMEAQLPSTERVLTQIYDQHMYIYLYIACIYLYITIILMMIIIICNDNSDNSSNSNDIDNNDNNNK